MEANVQYPEYYAFAGRKLTARLLRELQKGIHVALLGSRHCGVDIVLKQIRKSVIDMPDRGRPFLLVLTSADRRKMGDLDLINHFRSRLNLPARTDIRSEETFAFLFEETIREAVRNSEGRPVWILAEDILSFSTRVARLLLGVFQTLSEDTAMAGRHSVVVAGSKDFIALTYGNNSPYRYAEKYLIAGLDREYAETFIEQQRLPSWLWKTEKEVPGLLLEELYLQTGGQPYLIQELLMSLGRSDGQEQPLDTGMRFTPPELESWIRSRLVGIMENDFQFRSILREIQRDPVSFDLLLRVLNEKIASVEVPGNRPHELEVAGLIRRDSQNRAWIACPVWGEFLRNTFSPQYIADVYAEQQRWEKAWKAYSELRREDRSRSITGPPRFRIRSIILKWQNSLADEIANGPEKVLEQFFKGVKHLVKLEYGGLYDLSNDPPTAICREVTDLEEKIPIFGPSPSDEPAHVDSRKRKYWLDPPRLRLYSDPGTAFPGEIGTRPVLFLQRGNPERVIDTTDQEYLWPALSRFWQAYSEAALIEYRKTVGDLRERHLKVIQRVNELLREEPFDMGNVVQGAARSLIHDGGYYRVLICLVDPKGDSIQGVAGHCMDSGRNFDFLTDYDIGDSSAPVEEMDIQPWVVRKGITCVIPDAIDPDRLDPKTNTEGARRLEMKAITVVPMKLGEQVIGTLHIETEKKTVPGTAEIALFEMLAAQLAAAFQQARKLTLLQQAVSTLTDQLRIVNPKKQILFLNKAAASEHGAPRPGWQNPPLPCACEHLKSGEQARCLLPEVEQLKEPVHHYRLSEERREASDWMMAPIDDFRSSLPFPFNKANGRIGYVERVHNLTGLYQVLEAFQRWLSIQGLSTTADAIIEFFRDFGFKWVRIYLLKRPENGEEYLESLSEWGIRSERHRRRFLRGEIRYPKRSKDPQPWHVLLTARQAAVYEENIHLETEDCSRGQDLYGLPRFLTKWVQNREDLEKSDALWIEAPLALGDELIGKITFSMLEPFQPTRWEILKMAVAGAAAAMYAAKVGEDEVARKARMVEALAIREAVHQMGSKLITASTRVHNAIEDLSRAPEKASASLDMAFRAVEKCRKTLANFRNYASDKPFTDCERREVCALLDLGIGVIQRIAPGLKKAAREWAPGVSVRVSLSKMEEVFEILIRNSLLHSEKRESELEISLSSESVPAGVFSSANEVVISYRDNGKGIPEHRKEDIFKPHVGFSQQGEGLGLAIARNIVKRLGGRMTEEGKPGEGALFRIYLPQSEGA